MSAFLETITVFILFLSRIQDFKIIFKCVCVCSAYVVDSRYSRKLFNYVK